MIVLGAPPVIKVWAGDAGRGPMFKGRRCKVLGSRLVAQGSRPRFELHGSKLGLRHTSAKWCLSLHVSACTYSNRVFALYRLRFPRCTAIQQSFIFPRIYLHAVCYCPQHFVLTTLGRPFTKCIWKVNSSPPSTRAFL